MKNKILLVIILVLAVVYGFIGSFKKETSFFDNPENNVVIKNLETDVTQTLDVEEYLVGVLAGEMPASFDSEALKAQAVASRTYAYYKILTSTDSYDLTTDKTTQVYLDVKQMQDKWQDDYEIYVNKIKKAINDTKGQVMVYDGEIIPAYYFSMSNGYTENAVNVFNEDETYLKTVVSKEDVNNKNFMVTKIISKSKMCSALQVTCESIMVEDIIKNESNRISSITINNKTFTGVEVRKLLDLRSTDFEIKIDNDDIYITTYGYGHGVGMSQYGANTMAIEGNNYIQILKHYYTGVEIAGVDSII